MEASLTVVTAVASVEDTVEDDHVEVNVWIEGGAEAVQEADSAELGVRGPVGTGATEGGANRAQEHPEDGTGDVRVVMQKGT